MKDDVSAIGEYCLMPGWVRLTGRGDAWKLEFAEEGDGLPPAAPASEEHKPYLQQCEDDADPQSR